MTVNRDRLFAHKLRNNLQTMALVGTLGLLCAYLAWFIGGPLFALGATVGVILLYALNPAVSPRLVMALYQARPVAYAEAPRIYAVLQELARRAGLTRLPVLYYVPTRLMNAFTSGTREDAAIALSDGLLRRMDLRELAGVLAHEVSHIANGDTRVMALADLVTRITGLLSLAGQLLLLVSLPLWLLTGVSVPWVPLLVLALAPTVSALVQLALSRSREYEADRSAVELSGDPEGLAWALEKLDHDQRGPWERLMLPGQRIPGPSVLRTHPPTAERVRRLLELGARERLPRPVLASAPDRARDPFGFLQQHLPLPRWHVSGLWY